MRGFAAAACGVLLLVGMIGLVSFQSNSRAELLTGPDPDVHILPTAASTARSAMPSSWLSISDEKSSPLLQDSSDNAVQVLSTPGAATQAHLVQPAQDTSLAARPSPAARSSPPTSVPAVVMQMASATEAGSSSTHVSEAATSPLASLKNLPAVPGDRKPVPAISGQESQKNKQTHEEKAEHHELDTKHHADITHSSNWNIMVRKAEEAANALAKKHPRSVLGAHWREAVAGPAVTLQQDEAAAAKAGKTAQDQLVELAKEHLKHKGIYAPAAMCKEDNMPCPGTLQAKETSTGHYAPIRDNGPAPGEKLKSVKKAAKKVLVPARYPAVSFYAKVREELSSAEKAHQEPPRRTSMLASGEHVRRRDRDVELHREGEERRDSERRREENALRLEKSRERRDGGDRRSEDEHRHDTDLSISNRLYKLFTATSSASQSQKHAEELFESETRPSATELSSRDSIRSVEGSKLYEGERPHRREILRRPPPMYKDEKDDEEAEEDPEEEKEEQEREKTLQYHMHVKQAQERMAAKWREMMANPPPRTSNTRPDMLDKRELLIPRVGFKAKVKEWNDFKNAIEIYESDPEMNPINELQAHNLEKYGMMPPETDEARDWQAWWRQVTDKAQMLANEVAMLAAPVVDAKHRWDHGGPGDWCGTGGCATLAHEQRGERYVPPKPPAPDKLEHNIEDKLQKEIVENTGDDGRLPTVLTVSAAAPRHLPVLRSRGGGGGRDEGGDDEEAADDYRREDGPDAQDERRDFHDSESRHERRRSIRGDEGDEQYDRREQLPAPVKKLYSKVDMLQDEVSHLVKILTRRKLANREEGQERGDEDRPIEDRRFAERAEEEGDGEEGEAEAEGNTEEQRPHSRPLERQQLAARHVLDWLRGATKVARV